MEKVPFSLLNLCFFRSLDFPFLENVKVYGEKSVLISEFDAYPSISIEGVSYVVIGSIVHEC